MTDKYAEIRAALDGATPGPWIDTSFGGIQPTAGGALVAMTVTKSGPLPGYRSNTAYIAAANPEAIRALLAERDALREALAGITEKSSLVQSAADEIDRLRAALADMLDMYGGTRDCEGRRKDDYEMERINSAYAALTQQEQGK